MCVCSSPSYQLAESNTKTRISRLKGKKRKLTVNNILNPISKMLIFQTDLKYLMCSYTACGISPCVTIAHLWSFANTHNNGSVRRTKLINQMLFCVSAFVIIKSSVLCQLLGDKQTIKRPWQYEAFFPQDWPAWLLKTNPWCECLPVYMLFKNTRRAETRYSAT